jgi:hypothetical protein
MTAQVLEEHEVSPGKRGRQTCGDARSILSKVAKHLSTHVSGGCTRRGQQLRA